MSSYTAWYLFSVQHSHLVSPWLFCSFWLYPSFYNSPNLLTPLILLPDYWPITLLLNQLQWQILAVQRSCIPQHPSSWKKWHGSWVEWWSLYYTRKHFPQSILNWNTLEINCLLLYSLKSDLGLMKSICIRFSFLFLHWVCFHFWHLLGFPHYSLTETGSVCELFS